MGFYIFDFYKNFVRYIGKRFLLFYFKGKKIVGDVKRVGEIRRESSFLIIEIVDNRKSNWFLVLRVRGRGMYRGTYDM